MNISGSHHFSRLAQDYITAFDSSVINTFFAISPYDRGEALRSLIEKRVVLTSEQKELRKTLVSTLHSQHSNAGTLTKKVEENLHKLAGDRCCAVVTGQQVGIMGGPLYTIYKALHTIILANELSLLFPDTNFVPVFWQETEDHDFEETSSINIITASNEFRRIRYSPNSPETIARRQISGIVFEKEALERVFSELESFLQHTEFTDGILAFYKAAYQEDFTFAESQAQLLGELLSSEGLLILNANTRELKKHVAQLFRKEIETAPQLSERIHSVSKNLEKLGYHAQLDPQGANLFLSTKGVRYKLVKTDNGFTYGEEKMSNDEALRIASEEPERMSMNVVMRPLIQDTILPTVAYVAGPGEIAYFAQLGAPYQWAEMPMPMIVPRISITLIEEQIENLFAKYQIQSEAFIERGNELVKELLRSEQEDVIVSDFTRTNTELDKKLEALRALITSIDTTLNQALTTTKGKVLTAIKDLEGKALAAERRKQATARQQFERAMNKILPEGKLQERELNLLYFLNKYGFSFWKKFVSIISEQKNDLSQHQLLSLKTFRDE